MTNPFQVLYDQCNAGNSIEKYANLPEFPKMIDLEVTNTCNFRCLMCSTGNFSQMRSKGFMAEETFAKLVSECAEHGAALRFIGWGEPLTHPKIISFVQQATDAGLLTHLNTNGSKMTREMAENLIGAGLKSLKFSFQGVDKKSYGEMRNIDFFEELIETIKMFGEVRAQRGTPYLHVSTTITYETPELVEVFKTRVKPLVDLVSVGRTTFDWMDLKAVRLRPHELEMLKHLSALESTVKVHPECPEVFDKLSLNWDGKVSACCMDSDNLMTLGDLNVQTLAEIWHSNALEDYRRILADMRHDDLPLCKNCFDNMSLSKPGVQGT